MDPNQPTEMIPMPAVSDFEVVRRGYDRAQVSEAIERLDADVRIALTDRDAAVARASDLASQLSAVHAEMESLRRKLATTAAPTYETMGERIAHMLRLAEEEAAEIRRTAHTDTATLREEAQTMREQSEAEQHKAAAEQARVHEAAKREAAQVLTTANSKAAGILTEAERAATALTTQAESQRAQLFRESNDRNKRIEADFEISVRARRGEANRAEADRLRTSTAEATKRVADATAEAARRMSEADTASAEMIAHAEQDRARIEEIRHTALRQLRDVRVLLDGLPAETELSPSTSPGHEPPIGPLEKDPQGSRQPTTAVPDTQPEREPSTSGPAATEPSATEPAATGPSPTGPSPTGLSGTGPSLDGSSAGSPTDPSTGLSPAPITEPPTAPVAHPTTPPAAAPTHSGTKRPGYTVIQETRPPPHRGG